MRLVPVRLVRGKPKHRLAAIALATLAAGTAGAVTAALAAGGGSTAPDPGLSAAPMVSSVDVAVGNDFGAFNRPAGLDDSLSGQEQQYVDHAFAYAGANGSIARKTASPNGETFHLVAAGNGVCVVSSGGSDSFCAPEGAVTSGQAATLDLCSATLPQGQIQLEWLTPDGASNVHVHMSDGTTLKLPENYNVYVQRFSISGPLPTTIGWDAPSGQSVNFGSHVPGDVGTMNCVHPGDLSASKLQALRDWQHAKLSGEDVGPPPAIP